MKKIISNNFFVIKLLIKTTPILLIIQIVISLLSSLLDVLMYTYSFKYVIDSIEAGKDFSKIALFIAILFAMVLVVHFIKKRFEDFYIPISYEKLGRKLQSSILSKAKDIDISCYDSTEYFNQYVLVNENSLNKITDTIMSLEELFTEIISISAYITILLSMDYIGLIFSVISFILGVFTNYKFNHISFLRSVALQNRMRKRDYAGRIFYLPDYAKEIRLSRIKEILFSKFEESIDEIINENKKYTKNLIFLRFVNYLVTGFLTDVIYLVILIIRVVVLKTLSVGSFMALYLCMDKMGYFTKTLMDTISNLHNNSLYISKFRDFLNYKNNIEDNGCIPFESTKPCSIEFNDVSFKYPGNSDYTLKNINLKISCGETIAIVGYNGAGKTTLLKLLLRLYEPSKGQIYINEKNISMYKLDSYRRGFSTIFQDLNIYSAKIYENVAMNTLAKDKYETVLDSLDKSGLYSAVSKFEKGIESELGSEIFDDGKILSGGQIQKLALARVLYSENSNIIMDEPSSALDPISENEFMTTFEKNNKNNTCLIISHRLSAIQNVDRIFVLSKGEICESGTHEELMKKNGEYAKLYNIQAEKFCAHIN